MAYAWHSVKENERASTMPSHAHTHALQDTVPKTVTSDRIDADKTHTRYHRSIREALASPGSKTRISLPARPHTCPSPPNTWEHRTSTVCP